MLVKGIVSGVDNDLDLALAIQRAAIGIERALSRRLSAAESEAIDKILSSRELTELNRRDFNRILVQVAAMFNESIDGATSDAIASIKELSRISADSTAKLLGELVSGSVKIPKTVESLILNTPIAATGDMLQGFVDSLPARALNRIEQEMRISVVTGRANADTVDAVRRVFSTAKTRDVEAIISTATSHAFNVSRGAVYRANGISRVRAVGTLDVRICPACAAIDSQKFDIDSAPSFPLHTRCRCLLVPTSARIDALQKGATRSSDGGYVDQKVTALDYLRRKGKAELVDAYGMTIATAIKAESMTNAKFKSLALDRGLRPASIADMRDYLEKKGLL